MTEMFVVRTRSDAGNSILGIYLQEQEDEAKQMAKSFNGEILKVPVRPQPMNVDYAFDPSLEFSDMPWHIFSSTERKEVFCGATLKNGSTWRQVKRLPSDNSWVYATRTCAKCRGLHAKENPDNHGIGAIAVEANWQ